MSSGRSTLPEQPPAGKPPSALPPDVGFAASLRGFGPLGILAFLVILAGNSLFLPLSAFLVLGWAWWSCTPWREIGFARPKNWIGTVVAGVVLGAVFKILMKAIVMPLLGAPEINAAFHYLVGNTAVLPEILYVVIMGAGFGEEVFFRGYLFERLGKLLGSSRWAKASIVLITAIWFGWEHYSLQGIAGVQQATIVGLVFGAVYAGTGTLWMVMVAHTAFDLVAVAIIYWDLESRVAHLAFG